MTRIAWEPFSKYNRKVTQGFGSYHETFIVDQNTLNHEVIQGDTSISVTSQVNSPIWNVY